MTATKTCSRCGKWRVFSLMHPDATQPGICLPCFYHAPNSGREYSEPTEEQKQ